MFGLSKKLSKKKGFTLIEIMIVIAIIGLLSVIVIPKALPLKNQAKNNAVQANVYIVRSFLENRAGADKISIDSLIGTKTDAEALKLINDGIHNITGIEDTEGIASDMNTTFSGSSAVKNPFSGSIAINSSNQNIKDNDPENSSVVIGYDTGTIHEKVSDITSTINTPGVIAIIVYKTGYVLYGIDSYGVIIEPTLVNMPNNVGFLPDFTNPPPPLTTTPTSTTAILSNIDRVYDFLAINAAEKIIIGDGIGNPYGKLQSPLNDELTRYFKWNSSSDSASYNAIENPVISGFNQVIESVWDNRTALGTKYSVLVCGNVNSGSIDFSYFRGAVVVYVMDTNPIGYCIYGIDVDGNRIGERKLTLAALMNATTENNLSNNVKLVGDYLTLRVKNDISAAGGNIGKMSDNLDKDMSKDFKNSQISDVYVVSWQNIYQGSSTTFIENNSIFIGKWIAQGNDNFSKFKGSVIVNMLPNAVGYEVYGINYNGDRVGYKKIQ